MNKQGRLVQHGSKWAVPDLAIATDFNQRKSRIYEFSQIRMRYEGCQKGIRT